MDDFLVLMLDNDMFYKKNANSETVKKTYLSLRASWRDTDCSGLLSVVEAISILKPPGWFKSMQDIIQPVMLRKWDTVYGLVRFGQCLLLNAVVYILFQV
jgi:hypothetical protein